MQSNFHSWILEDACTEQFFYYTAKKGMRGRSTWGQLMKDCFLTQILHFSKLSKTTANNLYLV